MDFRAGKSLRLTKREDIRRVFTEGRRLADARLTLWGIPTCKGGDARPAMADGVAAPPSSGDQGAELASGPARCGVAVSKAHGKAVRRNRVKRICREAARLIRHELPLGWDFMIVPRAGAPLTGRGIQESLSALARRLAAGAGKGARP